MANLIDTLGLYAIIMPSAIVLINSEIGEESQILDLLCGLDEVQKAYLIYGVYDILAEVRASTMEDLEGIITQKLRQMSGVRSTLTLIISKQCK